jgi:hypothetical protein
LYLTTLPYFLSLVAIRLSTSTDKRLPIYEFYWLCNLTLFAAALSPLLNRPALAAALGVSVGVDQVLWLVDLLGYPVKGKFPVGVCAYLFWPSTTNARRLTSTHHLWTIPLLLHCCQGLHLAALPLSFLATSIAVCLTRAMTPESLMTLEPVVIKGEVKVPSRMGRPHYLNVNLA